MDYGGGIGMIELKMRVIPDEIIINGERYRLVRRKAKVGEKVIVVYAHKTHAIKPDDIGNVFSVEDIVENHEYIKDCVIVRDGRGIDCALYHEQYRVLEPVEPAENEIVTAEEDDDKSILDLLANLARRVTELEQKLNFVKSDVNMVIDDIVTLDERTQPLVALVKAVKADE
jgi:hypothetical protein